MIGIPIYEPLDSLARLLEHDDRDRFVVGTEARADLEQLIKSVYEFGKKHYDSDLSNPVADAARKGFESGRH